jgi:hypothetical protein
MMYYNIARVFEMNEKYVNVISHCEPQLGKRGLYPSSINPVFNREETHRLLHFLSFADGKMDLVEIAEWRKESALLYENLIQDCKKAGLIYTALIQINKYLCPKPKIRNQPDMELVPFSIINQYHKERLIHPARYAGNQFSFLKVFQHGLSFSLTKQNQKLIKNYLSSPIYVQSFIYYLKSKRGKKFEAPRLKENVILDPGRVVKGNDGAWHSIYFDKISKEIGQENLSIISMKDNAGIPYDYEFSAFQGALPALDDREKDAHGNHVCLKISEKQRSVYRR